MSSNSYNNGTPLTLSKEKKEILNKVYFIASLKDKYKNKYKDNKGKKILDAYSKDKINKMNVLRRQFYKEIKITEKDIKVYLNQKKKEGFTLSVFPDSNPNLIIRGRLPTKNAYNRYLKDMQQFFKEYKNKSNPGEGTSYSVFVPRSKIVKEAILETYHNICRNFSSTKL